MMHRQLVVTGFQIFDDEITGVDRHDLPVKILVQRMHGHQCARNYSARSILHGAANAAEGGLGLGGGEKNYARKQPCNRQI